jgi:mono/diheme cytochrome c family protein
VHLRPPHLLILLILSSAPLLNACTPAAAVLTPSTPEVTNTAPFLAPLTATIPPTLALAATVASTPTAPATTTPTTPATATPTVLPGNAVNGAKLFAKLPCSSCHDDTHPLPGGIVAPNLGNIATEAARIVKSADYHGKATDAAGYIRESIVDPNAYIVPGANYHTADGQSAMEKDFAQKLTPEQIDDLVAYLMTRQ